MTGKSYKQFLQHTKLHHAQRDLLDHPELTVAEIAARVGIADPFYFSRLFRSYVGVSPSEFRKNGGATLTG